MQQQRLLFEEESFAGPVDPETLRYIEKKHTLDPGYRTLLHACHGGIPVQQFIKGKGYRVGRFLTILERKSKLPGPFQPHFDQPKMDTRIARSVLYAIDGESATSRALFYGDRLLPFAALYYAGKHHPDEMCLDRACVDFLCFDYGVDGPRPPIVVWRAQEAARAFDRWEADGCPTEEGNPDIALTDYSSFTERIADDFDEFLTLLQSKR